MTVIKVNLAQKFSLFDEQWSPKLVGRVDEYAVKLAKLQGEFVWHHHEDEDELFLVVRGQLTIRLRDGEILLDEGEFVVIPRGIEHLPVADDECHVLLFERQGLRNTGNVVNERTHEQIETL
ncbi:MAG: cupin domain-containing protein [Candidatus Promineifilaceae bacterium]|nr:cupin domain-containing protein [Candidatus Promineifilaceae bacterium]